jgi:hypothetical protein
MRKVVALILVLGMASLANAGYEIAVSGTSAEVDNVGLAATYQGFFAVIGITGEVGVSGGMVGPQAPDLTGVYGPINDGSGIDALFPTGNGIYGSISSSSIATGSPLPLGIFIDQIVLEYTPGPKESPIQLWALNEDGTVGDLLAEGTVMVIPEPATLAILGLGALLLRRK